MSAKQKNRKIDVDEKNMPHHSEEQGGELPPGADLDDRFMDFMKQNGPSMLGAVALGALIVVGVMTYRYWQENQEEAVREAFQVATTVPELTAFAEDHEGHDLAALANLKVGNLLFNEGDYTQAASAYREALQGLDLPTSEERARLGLAMSLYMQGQEEEALLSLEQIANNAGFLDVTRAEAAYNLAIHRWEAGEYAKMGEAIDLILALEAPAGWAQQAQGLLQRVPEAARAATEPADQEQ